MGLSGDWQVFGKLKALVGRLEQVRPSVARKLAPRLDRRLQACFDAGTDPYGKPWAPLKPSTLVRKGGDARILIRTGMSRALTYVAALGQGVGITIGGALGWHMNPTAHRVARPILPVHGLPATWRQDAADVAGEEFAREIGGRS